MKISNSNKRRNASDLQNFKTMVLFSRLKCWWKALTLNERMLYLLVLAFSIGIVTRWEFIAEEAGEAFGVFFLR